MSATIGLQNYLAKKTHPSEATKWLSQAASAASPGVTRTLVLTRLQNSDQNGGQLTTLELRSEFTLSAFDIAVTGPAIRSKRLRFRLKWVLNCKVIQSRSHGRRRLFTDLETVTCLGRPMRCPPLDQVYSIGAEPTQLLTRLSLIPGGPGPPARRDALPPAAMLS